MPKKKNDRQMTIPMVVPAAPPNPALFPPQTVFDYHRTIVGYHGTRKKTAERLVDGDPFGRSVNDDDWLGHGIYFWEYAPQQAWWWADRRYKGDAAVFVPMQNGGGMARVWKRSGIFEGGHIQVCLRETRNILAVWSVKRDGRYGRDK